MNNRSCGNHSWDGGMGNQSWGGSMGNQPWGGDMGNQPWGGGMGNQPWGGNNQPQYLPTQTSPTQQAQPVVSPTRQYVQTNVSNTVVPHIHPSHTTIVNRHNINNQHYFPHTQSVVNEKCVTNTMCGKPYNPCHKHHKRCGY